MSTSHYFLPACGIVIYSVLSLYLAWSFVLSNETSPRITCCITGVSFTAACDLGQLPRLGSSGSATPTPTFQPQNSKSEALAARKPQRANGGFPIAGNSLGHTPRPGMALHGVLCDTDTNKETRPLLTEQEAEVCFHIIIITIGTCYFYHHPYHCYDFSHASMLPRGC